MNWMISLAAGAGLVVAGLVLMRWHSRSWLRRQDDPELSDNDRWHYRRQYRRRMQASGLFVIIGLLIPLVDYEPLFRRYPLLWTTLIIVILVLTLWVALLAAGDLLSTRAHSRVALARLHQKQRELEREAAQLQSRQSNGHRDLE